eukprot:gene7143-9746_t
MIRHGESTWNQENRFTGWCDIPLTAAGENDAKDAGTLMGERGLKFDVAFTSTLERAWRTCALTLSEAGQSGVEVVRSWKLNERHYGALQGHLKTCPKLIEAFGNEKIMEWRRSFHTAPPSMYDVDILKMIGSDALQTCTSLVNPNYINLHALERTQRELAHNHDSKGHNAENNTDVFNHTYPATESLLQCQERAYGYWKDTIAPRVRNGERVLIVAHANTIRALVKAVDHIDDDMITHLKIPNGVPLVYTLDEDLEPIVDLTDDLGFQAKYLVSARNHGRMMEYERCTRKKLRSLFEYLDVDGDGRITLECLLNGLNKLQNTSGGGLSEKINSIVRYSGNRMYIEDFAVNENKEEQLYMDVFEYEIEEIIRCVPHADEYGGITLQSFLDSEATLLPRLSKLRLLQ